MESSHEPGGRRPSNILRLSKMLSDEGKVSAIGSRVIRRQIEEIARHRMGGGIGPLSWTDAWVDQGGWGTDVWENSWASDFWDDYLGPKDPVARQPTRPEPKPPELVFSDEELDVLRELKIIDRP